MKALDFFQGLWNGALLTCLVCGLVFYLHPDFTMPLILPIEFAENITEVLNLADSIENGRKQVRSHTLLDFAFILCYTALFYASLKIFFLSIGLRVNTKIYLVCLLPAFFDVIENFALLNILKDADGQGSSFYFLFWSVRLKWLVLIPFMMTTLSITLYHLLVRYGKIRNHFLKEATPKNTDTST